jgi:phosphoribosylformylglycinamidine synthase PurS subunit
MDARKYRVITMLRSGIKDNQGTAVAAALRTLGFPEVIDCRIGKMYEIDYEGDDIEKIAKNISNEVMEDYTIEEIQ